MDLNPYIIERNIPLCEHGRLGNLYVRLGEEPATKSAFKKILLPKDDAT